MIISNIKDFEKELPKFESQIKGNDELFSENEDPAVTKRIDWIKTALCHFGKSPDAIVEKFMETYMSYLYYKYKPYASPCLTQEIISNELFKPTEIYNISTFISSEQRQSSYSLIEEDARTNSPIPYLITYYHQNDRLSDTKQLITIGKIVNIGFLLSNTKKVGKTIVKFSDVISVIQIDDILADMIIYFSNEALKYIVDDVPRDPILF